MFYSKFLYNQNWNIGFTEDTVESFMERKALNKVIWMKHNFRDRFFADPFVLRTTDDEIIVFAEELIFSETKGRIVKLTIDKNTKRLLERTEILEQNTHLSYPAIFRLDNLIYIYPENSKSGELKLYSYTDELSQVTAAKTLVKEPLVDSTIIRFEGKFWLVATKTPNSQEFTYLYASESFDGEYVMIDNDPIVSDKSSARPAGNFIVHNDNIYRPAQICVERYGAGIAIKKVDLMSKKSYCEKTIFNIYPTSFRYNLGLHTINFYDGGCVIDGCGYLYPVIGRVLNLLRNIKVNLFNG